MAEPSVPRVQRSQAHRLLLKGMQKDVWSARVSLLIVMLGFIVGAFAPLAEQGRHNAMLRGHVPERELDARMTPTRDVFIGMAVNLGFAAIFFQLFFMAKKKPVGTLKAAFLIYASLQVLGLAIGYRMLLLNPAALVIPIVLALTLLYGVRSAKRYAAAMAELQEEAQEEKESQAT